MEYGEEDAHERNGKAAQGAKREHGAVTDENGGDFVISGFVIKDRNEKISVFFLWENREHGGFKGFLRPLNRSL